MDIFRDGKIVLGIAAHPDDLDFGGAATVSKAVKMGAKCYYLILTDGSRGSEDMSISNKRLIEIRREEQKKAGKIIGLENVYFLDYQDGELMNTPQIRRDVIKVIRSLKPDIVITTDPTFVYDLDKGYLNHPDHRVAGEIALNCVFPFARNSRTYPELLDEGHGPHKVQEVLLLMNNEKSNYFVDVTDAIETKLDALRCHDSQFDDFEELTEWIKDRAKKIGEKADCKYAEGFVRIHIDS